MKNLLRKTMILSGLLVTAQAHSMSFLESYFGSYFGYSTVSSTTQPAQAPKSQFSDILLKNCKDASMRPWLSNCGLQDAGQILQRAINQKRSDVITFMMPYVSKEDRGAALLYAIKSRSVDMVKELLKHKIAEKALWESLIKVAASYSSDKEQCAALILQNMKSLTLTEKHAQEVMERYACDTDLGFLARIELPTNVQNMLVKVLVKNGLGYELEQFLHKRTLSKLDSTTVEQRGISDRVIRKVAKDNTSPAVAALLAKKFYENKEELIKTYRKFDIAMLQTWTDDSKADFYKHYDSVRTGTTCSNAVVESVTPTAHLVHNFLLIQGLATRLMKPSANTANNYQPQDLAYNLIKTNMINRVCQLEKEFEAQGRTAFVHARRWEWNFVNDIWNMILAIKNNENCMSNAISLRYRIASDTSTQDLYQFRKELIEKGVSGDEWVGSGTNKSGKHSELTFMNYSPLSNFKNSGECSGAYFYANRSIAAEGAGFKLIKTLFAKNGLQFYYDKYESELEKLYQLHQESNSHGEILCLGFDNKNLDSMVYPANPGGYHKGQGLVTSSIIHTQKECLQNNSTFTDPGTDDLTIFCFACSDIPGERGDKYTIKSLHNADPVKYTAYEKQRDALFADMKKAK